MSDQAREHAARLILAGELRKDLDDPKRGDWGGYPWEHLGDAERDVRQLLSALAVERAAREQAEQALRELRAAADDLVTDVAQVEAARKRGITNRHQHTVLAASSMRVEAALAASGGTGQ